MPHTILQTYLTRYQKVLETMPELATAGAPVLRQPARAVTWKEGMQTAERLIKSLQTFRNTTGVGRGIAAPQIGEGVAVFVTYEDDTFHAFINPRVVESSPTTNFYQELCISTGPMAADVERPEWVVMEWQDQTGTHRREKLESFRARLYQHEEAHLRGLLCIDEARPGGLSLMDFDPTQQTLRPKNAHEA